MAPASEQVALSAVGVIARTYDPDRFLLALFAPPGRREAILTLVAFNHELARALDVAASARGDYGAVGGEVRLQWWRDVINGEAKRHEVAAPMSALLQSGALDPALLLGMIEARAMELDGFDDLHTWQQALRTGPGHLARAIATLLGTPPQLLDRVADAGVAYAIGKILRHLPTLRALGRRPLPQLVLHQDDQSAAIAWGLECLARARTLRLARPQRAAALSAVLAHRDLLRASAARPQDRPRGFGDRLAVTTAYLTGRL